MRGTNRLSLSYPKVHSRAWTLAAVMLAGIIILTPRAYYQSVSQSLKSAASNMDGDISVVIYYFATCHTCVEYVSDVKSALSNMNITNVQEKELTNDLQARTELSNLHQRWSVPLSMQGFPVVAVDQKFLFENLARVDLIVDFLTNETDHFEMIVAFRWSNTTYKIIANSGEVREYQLSESDRLWDMVEEESGLRVSEPWILPLILASGLADGINPCAFAVLIFFISFLFTLKKTRFAILATGLTYIGSLYLVYLLIGLGLLQAISLFNIPHLIAKIGAILIIVLGSINIKDYFWFGKGPSLKIPSVSKSAITNLAHKSTMPSAAILGALVGLFEFPCTGAIYGAIVFLVQTYNFTQGLFYLIIYNLMFVLPLLLILFIASNPKVTQKISVWRETRRRHMKLATGVVMIGLGLLLLFVAF